MYPHFSLLSLNTASEMTLRIFDMEIKWEFWRNIFHIYQVENISVNNFKFSSVSKNVFF